MSACNEYAEFVGRLVYETGAPPHIIMPHARRLRRLATRHHRLCEVACNGCARCTGFSPRPGVWFAPTHPEDGSVDRPCPGCSTDTVEAAITETMVELARIGDAHRPGVWGATYQHDPRGATVRLRVPSGSGDDFGGICVPTSAR